jgi:BirA family biotin operon repressor/biotin-[acetyl-CoA-carboxylase] ligase
MMRWPAEAIWEQVVPLLPGFTVEVLPQIDSTNSELMRRARAGQTEPTLLIAETQTAGRGRMGRAWHGAAGDSLTFSLGLPLDPADWSGLSLAVGVAVADSLHADIRIKWPNDLWLSDCKLGGILVETAAPAASAADGTAARQVVVGIGINIAPRDANGLSTPPAWLQALEPGISAPQALQRIALPLVQTLQTFAQQGFGPFADRFSARDVLRGRTVTLSDGRHGTAQGVSGGGALLVHTGLGQEQVISSEVSVRPLAAPLR